MGSRKYLDFEDDHQRQALHTSYRAYPYALQSGKNHGPSDIQT